MRIRSKTYPPHTLFGGRYKNKQAGRRVYFAETHDFRLGVGYTPQEAILDLRREYVLSKTCGLYQPYED